MTPVYLMSAVELEKVYCLLVNYDRKPSFYRISEDFIEIHELPIAERRPKNFVFTCGWRLAEAILSAQSPFCSGV